MDGLGSLTLIVKAPNQRIEDQRVACNRSWTVKQLKEHLSAVHPEKPHQDQQKLVYFGKLLKDEACLQEVLNQESYDDAHTVHLVCPSRSAPEISKPYIPRFSTQVNELRQRVPTSENAQQVPQFQQPPTLSHEYMQQWNSSWNQMLTMQIQQSGQMTPQQQMWIRWYQQQSNQFNNLMQYQASIQQGQQTLSFPEATQPQREEAPAEAPQARAAPPEQDDIVRMNAQGGIDAEDGQHDWLDTMYAFVRFAMLLLLLYFYTTFGRFAIVILVGVFFYLAQGNMFRLQRRRPAAQPAPQQPQQNEQNQAENQNNENNERYNIANPTDEGTQEHNNNNATAIAEQNNASWLDGFKLVATFIVTFFTSLIPQNPAAIPN